MLQVVAAKKLHSIKTFLTLEDFYYRLEQPSERLPDDHYRQGLKLGLKLKLWLLCRLTNKL